MATSSSRPPSMARRKAHLAGNEPPMKPNSHDINVTEQVEMAPSHVVVRPHHLRLIMEATRLATLGRNLLTQRRSCRTIESRRTAKQRASLEKCYNDFRVGKRKLAATCRVLLVILKAPKLRQTRDLTSVQACTVRLARAILAQLRKLPTKTGMPHYFTISSDVLVGSPEFIRFGSESDNPPIYILYPSSP